MNWRNPFLITYLSVTVVGAGIFGYLLYSGYSHYSDVEANYEDAVTKLNKLQTKIPFPSAENNKKYVEYTKQYRAEYDQLLARVGKMQKGVDTTITPQAFQDQLRANVSEVEAAAKDNNVTLGSKDNPDSFYLGFDQYRGTLPPDGAAGPLARELAAIRLVVDDLIALKVSSISGIQRDLLPEESGSPAPASSGGPIAGSRNNRRGGGGGGGGESSPRVVSSSAFNIVFDATQSATRGALNNIADADQFFIIRNLSIRNSAPEGPKKVEDITQQGGQTPSTTAPTDPNAPPAAPAHSIRVLLGREILTVGLRIEMITFNNLSPQK